MSADVHCLLAFQRVRALLKDAAVVKAVSFESEVVEALHVEQKLLRFKCGSVRCEVLEVKVANDRYPRITIQRRLQDALRCKFDVLLLILVVDSHCLDAAICDYRRARQWICLCHHVEDGVIENLTRYICLRDLLAIVVKKNASIC